MKEIKIKSTNEIIYNEKLDNGLDIYLYPNNKSNFYMSLMTKYGGKDIEFKRKDEDEYHKIPFGVAHFLEHITFHLDGKDADELFAPYGVYINAFTNARTTRYLVEGSQYFKECLDTLLYYVYTPYYTEETVEHEKGIIKEERKRSDDNPNATRHYKMMEALFNNSYYKGTVLGTLDEIDSISLDDINAAYNTFYHPGNMNLVIAGNFDINEALDIIKNRMNTFTFTEYKGIDRKIPKEEDKVAEENVVLKKNVLTDSISISYKMPKKIFEDLGLSLYEYTTYLDMIMNLNFGKTSEYAEEVVKQEIAPYRSGVYTDLYDDYICIHIQNTIRQGKKEEFIKLTEKYLFNMNITDKDVLRKRNSHISDYILSFDDNENVVNSIQDDILYFDEVKDNLLEVIKKFDKEIGNKIINILDFNNRSIVELTSIND